jgi:hypothetical protein
MFIFERFFYTFGQNRIISELLEQYNFKWVIHVEVEKEIRFMRDSERSTGHGKKWTISVWSDNNEH